MSGPSTPPPKMSGRSTPPPQERTTYANVSAFLHLESPLRHGEVYAKIRRDLPASPTKITPQGTDGRCYRVFFADPADVNRAMKTYNIRPQVKNSRLEIPRRNERQRTTPATVIIRDVERSIDDDEIRKQTTLQGTLEARRIISGQKGVPTTFVRITTKTPEDAAKMLKNGLTMNGKQYATETPNHQPRITRCYNCQELGTHMSARCPNKRKCPDCAKDHPPTENCDEEKRCANCGGNHPAYHKTCPAWTNKIRETRETARTTTKIEHPKKDVLMEQRMLRMETEIVRLKEQSATKEEVRQVSAKMNKTLKDLREKMEAYFKQQDEKMRTEQRAQRKKNEEQIEQGIRQLFNNLLEEPGNTDYQEEDAATASTDDLISQESPPEEMRSLSPPPRPTKRNTTSPPSPSTRKPTKTRRP